ncbi:hypothetical protein PVK06_041471 [Gossypium arboreum]|uniref:RNase H type-1 domain-containing protein n=1 Tax=Gossypium arboreum TaxID=29729 RepID=A0ABR0NAH1_GOSAR|nr:hypothetical protein PVK06_041471 [Gossypium arboreum]
MLENIDHALRTCPLASSLEKVKLNADGGVDVKFGNAMAEVVVRGPKGDWIFGYGLNLRVSSILDAKLQVILDGVRIAWDKGVCRLLVKSDSKSAVETILGIVKIGTHKVGLESCSWMKRDW